MQWDVKLQGPFSYSKLGIILLIGSILIMILISIIIKIKNKPKIEKPSEEKFDLEKVKKEYLTRIDNLMTKVNNNQLIKRKAYNELSLIIREFIYKTTNIDVLKYTLAEAKLRKNKELVELLNEYYEPEFSKEGKGDLISSIDKTRKVIIEWK